MKIHKILECIRQFESTGIINDGLIPMYDQNGKWRGDKNTCPREIPKSTHAKIRRSVLPPSRRTVIIRSGTALLTSFYWRGNDPAKLTYSEIRGSLIVTDHASLHAANLRRIGGHFLAYTNHRVYLPNLTSVGGNFEAMKGFLLKSPRLREVGGNMMVTGYVPPRLEAVGGRLGVYWLFEVDFSRLKHIGGYFVAPKAEAVLAPELETIGGGFLINEARKVDAPVLRTIGGDFLAGSVTDLHAPYLRIIGGDMDTRSAEKFYHPAIRVGGDWTICHGAMDQWVLRAMAREAIRGNQGPLYL